MFILISRVVPECMLEPRQNGKKRRHPIHKKKSSQNEEEESVDAAKSRKVQKCHCSTCIHLFFSRGVFGLIKVV